MMDKSTSGLGGYIHSDRAAPSKYKDRLQLAKLQPGDLGRRVVYVGKYKGTSFRGTIARWNEQYVFVKYEGEARPIAARPENLRFEEQRAI